MPELVEMAEMYAHRSASRKLDNAGIWTANIILAGLRCPTGRGKMIYTRWGNPIKIIADCGKHIPLGGVVPLILVRVERQVDKKIRYQFVEFLRADEGRNEILNVLHVLPKHITVLSAEQLVTALQQAS